MNMESDTEETDRRTSKSTVTVGRTDVTWSKGNIIIFERAKGLWNKSGHYLERVGREKARTMVQIELGDTLSSESGYISSIHRTV